MDYEVIETSDNDKVRLCVAPEWENYFSVYGEPDGYTDADGNKVSPEDEHKNIADMIDRDGLWYYFSQVKCATCGQWSTVDGIGMVIGSIDDSGYKEDLLAAARAELD